MQQLVHCEALLLFAVNLYKNPVLFHSLDEVKVRQSDEERERWRLESSRVHVKRDIAL